MGQGEEQIARDGAREIYCPVDDKTFPCHSKGFLSYFEPLGSVTWCYLPPWKITLTTVWRIAWMEFRIKTLVLQSIRQIFFHSLLHAWNTFYLSVQDVGVLGTFKGLGAMLPLNEVFLDLLPIKILSLSLSLSTSLLLSNLHFSSCIRIDICWLSLQIKMNIKRE